MYDIIDCDVKTKYNTTILSKVIIVKNVAG
jgi:hypothetical protein